MTARSHTPDKGHPHQFDARDFPAIVLIATSSPCNLKCPACPCTLLPDIRDNPGLDGRRHPYFSLEHYKKITDECAAHATDTFQPRLRLSGYGEPLLNKQLGEMIAYSASRGVPTSLITNGQLLSGAMAELLLDSHLESMEFSVDAHEPGLYETMRPGGDFQTLTDNVRRFLALRAKRPHAVPRVIASVVRTPANDAVISEIEQFWLKDVGVDHVSVRKFLTWGLPPLEDMKSRLDDTPYMATDAPCPYPYERVLIDPAGWIRLCPYDDQKKIPDFGHVSQVRLADVWKGSRFSGIRSCHRDRFDADTAMEKAPLCADCEDRRNRSWTHNYLDIVTRQLNADARSE